MASDVHIHTMWGLKQSTLYASHKGHESKWVKGRVCKEELWDSNVSLTSYVAVENASIFVALRNYAYN